MSKPKFKIEPALKEAIAAIALACEQSNLLQRDKEQIFDRKLWDQCGQERLQGLPVPEDMGGGGYTPEQMADILEYFGFSCNDHGLVFAISAHLFASVVPVWKYGSPAQHEKYLPALCNGSLIAANAMTEQNSGSDVYNLQTAAKKVEGGYILNGSKKFITNAPVADLLLVYASTDKEKGFFCGLTAFILDKKDQWQVSERVDKMGLRTTMMGDVVFDNVFVADENILGQPGSGGPIFATSMDWERTFIACTHIGLMERLLDVVVDYIKKRKLNSKSVSDHQAVSHPIAEIKVGLEASKNLVAKAVSNFTGKKNRTMDAAIAKLFVSETLKKSTLAALQILGGNGYLTGFEIERMVRDACGSTIYSGTSEIQKNIIAKYLGL